MNGAISGPASATEMEGIVPHSDQNWIKPKEGKPLYLRVIKAVAPILEDLYSKNLLSKDKKILLSAFLPCKGDISVEEIQEGCQNILRNICFNFPIRSYQNFPQAVQDAIKQKVCLYQEKIEKLNPAELYYVPQGDFALNLFSEKGSRAKPAGKLLVLLLLKHFVQSNPYLASQLKEPLAKFFDKFMETTGWVEELNRTDTPEFRQSIQVAVECTAFLTVVNPTLKESLLNCFRRVVKSSLLSIAEELLPRMLPKLEVLAEASSPPLGDLPAERIELLKKIFADRHTSLKNRESCLVLLSSCAPNFVNQKITVILAEEMQKELSPLQCTLLRNLSDQMAGQVTIALPQVSVMDFVQFWDLIVSPSLTPKANPFLTFDKWITFFEIGALLKIQDLTPVLILLNEQMLGKNLESFSSFLKAINKLIQIYPRYAADCVNTRDLLVSAFFKRLQKAREDLDPYFEPLQLMASEESMCFQTFYVRCITKKTMHAVGRLQRQPTLVFEENAKAPQANLFQEHPRLKSLVLPSSWKLEDLKASASLQLLTISFALDPTQNLRELLTLYPKLRELRLLQNPAVPFTMPTEMAKKYPNLKLFINNQEVFKGETCDLEQIPIFLKRDSKKRSSNGTQAYPSSSRKKKKAPLQPPVPAAAAPPAPAQNVDPSTDLQGLLRGDG